MKKILIVLLAFSSVSLAQAPGDDFLQPSGGKSDYLRRDRLVSTDITGKGHTLITDTATGCQYLVMASNRAPVKLGCFEEYKKK